MSWSGPEPASGVTSLFVDHDFFCGIVAMDFRILDCHVAFLLGSIFQTFWFLLFKWPRSR